MDETQLRKAQKEQGYGIEITLIGNRMYVAIDGYITDDFKEITAKKRWGTFGGFYYQYTKKGYIGEMIAVIRAINRGCSDVLEGVTA